MILNDITGNGAGIFQEINSICDSDDTSYLLVDKTRRVNNALIDLELKALMADGKWHFDDSNYVAQPSGVINFVDGQQEYAFDSTLLFIERIEILLIDGVTWQKLDPMDEFVIRGAIGTQLQVIGVPTKYYKRGNFFGFNFIPKSTNVTITGGIKVFFKRLGTLFVPTDTTKSPGIVSTSHITIAQKASLQYCRSYKPDRVTGLLADITAGEAQHISYYANRAKDERVQMTMKHTDSR